jgi:hypothetical protein
MGAGSIAGGRLIGVLVAVVITIILELLTDD